MPEHHWSLASSGSHALCTGLRLFRRRFQELVIMFPEESEVRNGGDRQVFQTELLGHHSSY
jgi:hypothetical protein